MTRLHAVLEATCDRLPGPVALEAFGAAVAYAELDRRANRLARYLRLRGAGPGDRVALLFDHPLAAHVGMVAVLKAGAAFLTLDEDGSVERAASVVADAGAALVLTHAHRRRQATRIASLALCAAQPLVVDDAARLIGQLSAERLLPAERQSAAGHVACLLYPDEEARGVAVDHATLDDAVRLAVDVYDVGPGDRVYQGNALTTGFGVEASWMAWAAGATLVGGAPDLHGPRLRRFLAEQRVSVLCCPPSLLATLDDDLPELRLLLVAGDPCPQDLATRWARSSRRLFTACGPAAAVGTVNRAELRPPPPRPGGRPLAAEATVVIDLPAARTPAAADLAAAASPRARGQRPAPFPRAATGPQPETAYPPTAASRPAAASRPTAPRPSPAPRSSAALAPGPVPLPSPTPARAPAAAVALAPSMAPPRRQAALVALAGAPAIAAPAPAVARTARQAPAPTAPATSAAAAPAPARSGAPVFPAATSASAPSVVPATGAAAPMALVAAAVAPTSAPPLAPVDLAAAPSATLSAASARPTAAALEGVFGAVLAEVLQVPEASVEEDFFADLGADSLVMAQFCARLRKRGDAPQVSIKDVYRHTTIQTLAAAFAAPPPAPLAAAQDPALPPMPVSRSKPRYVLCGALQLLAVLTAAYAVALGAFTGFEWIVAAPTLLDTYLRSVAVGGGAFLGLGLLPIVAKWTLIGRWKPRQIPVWSLAYLRFWLVKTLIRTSPLVRFAGTPLYLLYLRALGAKIGKGVTVLSTTVPVCTDLLTIGAGTVIRKDASFTCYRAHDGRIQIAPVTLGRDVYVGEATVLDIGTAIGDGAQLGHTSALHAGQTVPAGEHHHGSPAEPTDVDYRIVPSGGRLRLRRFALSVLQVVGLLAVVLPTTAGGAEALSARVPQLAAVSATVELSLTSWSFYADAVAVATALYFGALLLGLLAVVTVPRVLRLVVRPGRDYRLYGVRYGAHRAIGRLTNRKVYTRLFGDSSFIVFYLRSLGYDLFRVEQTGSNFGTDVRQDNPFLSAVGSGTVIADGLSIVNADYSNTHFRVSPVRIGARNFLGNRIAYPAQGRTGENCLLATKVMVPIDGPERTGVGLLGSPSFAIPRTVERDNRLDVQSPQELRRLVSAKARHNALTIAAFLVTRWLLTAALTVLGLVTLDLYPTLGAPIAALVSVVVLPFTLGYFLLVDRLVRRLAAHRPAGCSIYDRAFWRHERFWKLCADTYVQVFNGTPLKNLIWRMLGVRIGRRVFDDGAFITERVFATIGDRVTLNAGSIIQCHSQEDGAFKSDRTVIGAGATLGVNAFVHYGVTLGDRAALEADSFLMKGGEVPADARWGGNPATELDA